MKENPSAPLSLYMGFTSLRASQLSVLLGAMSNIYSLVADENAAFVDIFEGAFPRPVLSDRVGGHLESDLCLEFARTGNSIEFRFTGRPRREAAQTPTEKIRTRTVLATVASVIALAGQGQTIYDRHEDSVARRRTEQELGSVQADKVRAETEAIRSRIARSTPAPANATRHERRHQAIAKNVLIIQQVINAPNINVATINGIPLKNADPDETPELDNDSPGNGKGPRP